MRFAIAAPLILIMLSGCTVQKSYVQIEKKQFSDDNINIELPRFQNFSDNGFEKSLNDNYNRSVGTWIENFEKERSKDEECSFRLEQQIMRNKAPVISVVGEAYVYTGGVHGAKSRIAENIDVIKNEDLKLADLFEDNSYEEALNRQIQSIAEANPDQYHDLWEKPMLSGINQEFFYLTDKELVVFYPPYELSYYAKGFVEFRIPYKDIVSYLKQEYKAL